MVSASARRALIERLEGEAAVAPGRYRAKVALLALAGFAVLGGAVVLAFGLSIGLVLLLAAISPWLLLKLAKLIWIPIGFGWVLLRSLWVKFSPPDGHRLAAHEAPALWAEVEHLRVATGAPKLTGIVIDAALNAAAVSVPRAMGLLGHRHYLLLGLPLMQLLDRSQFASVVAHEFGHFGGGHGRFTGWIYHVRVSWYRLLGALQVQEAWASKLFVRFFNWYAPYFDAYSFVMARAQEYEADAAAARVASPQAAGQALIRVDVGAARLEQEFWPGLQRASQTQPAPPALLYREIGEYLRVPASSDGDRLAQALARVPDFDDTHPTLAQRLAALGIDRVDVPEAQAGCAGELLGPLLTDLERRFSDDWRVRVEEDWQRWFRQHAQDRARLEALEALPSRTPDEAVEYAGLVESLRPETDALPIYQQALALAPEHALARFRVGCLLLDRGDAAGIGHLEKAIALDDGNAEAALQRLDSFYRDTGDLTGRDRVADEWARIQARWSRVQQARNTLAADDEFLPHGLDAPATEALRAALARVGGVGRAWLVRKRLPPGGEAVPHHVMLVALRGFVWSQSAKLQQVVDALVLPGSVLVFVATNRRGIARRVRKVAGAPLYRRGWW
ncbi:M48 family metalloprotease [Thermomonas sp. S9]|uniref:M48 family metalloprotease n=1 Tax=Thermomonas sp. S9 TaxID=2885203 RepID=UPI00216ACA15|nr:M48 family metalloprotease [Thermomonas sp. S9]MCR6494921.1 M48 family metalloprotease [Thermomonas sp. S9]